MTYLKKYILNIDKEILEGFYNSFIDNELKSFLTSGSKKIRSILALLYLKSLNVKIDENIYKILAVGEIIHNASLLHDDVIDNAVLRRNNTTIAKKYSSKISILAGDFLLTYAIEKLLNLNNADIIKDFNQCAKSMCQAEILQFFLKEKLPTENEYLEICMNKTAKLFSSILKSCAIISNIDSTLAANFGLYFGICFQIKNDFEKESAIQDKLNKISTAKDILGIEKTRILLDNYKEKMLGIILKFPDNLYKEELRDLIKKI